eukprot:Gb_41482 [translate_table: standard]
MKNGGSRTSLCEIPLRVRPSLKQEVMPLESCKAPSMLSIQCAREGDLPNPHNHTPRKVIKDRLYADREELSEDEDQYKSDVLSLKASGLHRIAAKPEVFPCKDLFTHAVNFCRLEKGRLASPVGILAIITGFVFRDLYKMPKPDMVHTAESAVAFLKGKDLVKEVMRGWAEDPTKIKRRFAIDYPISYFRKGIRVGMAMLNRLWGKANIDRVDQLWVPLLGEIIVHDKKSDFVELLAYNLHHNWEIAKGGKSFFMASYIVDACCASLRFNPSQLPEWPHPLGAPIHTLFEPLYIYKYHCFIATICEYFYPVVYRAIRGTEMPRFLARVRDDLSIIGPWWFFKDHIVIRVEGVLTTPNMLLMHVPDRLASFEVAAQCLFGVVEKCKRASQRPYPQVPFSIGDMYFQNWPSLHLTGLRDKVSQDYYHQPDEQEDRFYLSPASWEDVLQRIQEADDARMEEEEAEETDEVLTRSLLRGFLTTETMIPDPTGTTTVPSTSIDTPHSQVAPQQEASPLISASTSPSQALDVVVPPVITLPEISPITAPTKDTLMTSPTPPPFLGPSQESEADPPPFSRAPPRVRSRAPPPPPKNREAGLITPPDLDRGIQVSPLVSLKTPVLRSPAFSIIPKPPHTTPIAPPSTGCEEPAPTSVGVSSLAVVPPSAEPIKGSRSQWFATQLARAEATGGVMAKPPEVTLEYDKATSSLKKVTRRRIRIGRQVSTVQTEENVLSLTRKRKRETRSKDLGDEELVADPLSTIRLTNKMSEEAVERMHLELTQGRDKIVAPPLMGVEITGSVKELYRSFTRAKEARGRGEEVHQKIEASLEKIDEWNAKLATLGNVARRNQLSSLALMGVEDIATCESVLARTRQALEDGGAPLAIFNRQLESSSRSVKSLLDSTVLPPVRKPDDSAPIEFELEASLGEFVGHFSRQLASVEEKGNQAIHEFVVQVPRKVERALPQGVLGSSLGRAYPGCVQGRRTVSMEHRADKGDIEGDHPIPHSSSHEARWEAYLMAWEMMRSLEADIATLDKSVKDMQGELRQVKSATQSLFTVASQIVRELSYVRSRSTSTPRDCPPREPSSSWQPILGRFAYRPWLSNVNSFITRNMADCLRYLGPERLLLPSYVGVNFPFMRYPLLSATSPFLLFRFPVEPIIPIELRSMRGIP